ncbi:MAG: hypothetical protein AAF770_01675 [Bacteroidota bacterium]
MNYFKNIVFTICSVLFSLLLGAGVGISIGLHISSHRDKSAFLLEKKALVKLYQNTIPFQDIHNLPSDETIIKEDMRKLENIKAAFAQEKQPYAKGWFAHERSEVLITMRQTRAMLLESQTAMLIFLHQYIRTMKGIKKIGTFLAHIFALSIGIVTISLMIFLVRKRANNASQDN